MTESPTTQPLPPKLAALLDTLDLFEDRADRIQVLIDIADRFREVPPEIAARPFAREHEVQHCESGAFVWAECETEGDGIRLHFAVENPQGISAKALAVILDESLSGLPLAAIEAVPQDLPYRIFGKELSMGKSMGLTNLVTLTQYHARRAAATPA